MPRISLSQGETLEVEFGGMVFEVSAKTSPKDQPEVHVGDPLGNDLSYVHYTNGRDQVFARVNGTWMTSDLSRESSRKVA
jgi:hypothetical protein